MKRIGEVFKKIFSSRKRTVWILIGCTVLVLLGIGGVQAYRILYSPQDLFNIATMKPTAQPTEEFTPEPTQEATEESGGESASAAASGTPAATPTAEPTAAPTPGITESKDILNILLIGIDRSQTVGKGSGRDPHADVMMVVAVNFKKKTADLISLPRDTFVHAPDIMEGVYKLNASFNVGGGFAAKDGGGFRKVCEAAEYMLGGIPVDYYYAVDFTSLMKAIDTIGGVDYVVEDRAYSRRHIKGKQHMNGADVLFYMRTRKAGPDQGDWNRVIRQKKLILAIFDQVKKNGKISMLPDLVSTAKSGIYTNTTVEQTLALANFAKTVGTEKVGMYSMEGHRYDKGGWRYCFTDQADRKTIIKKVYGINVPEQARCSPKYADWLLDDGLDAIRSLKTAKQLQDFADKRKEKFTTEQQNAYASLAASYKTTKAAYDKASLSMKGSDTGAMSYQLKRLRTYADKLAKLVGYKEKLVWAYNHPFWLDPAINPVNVDFR